MEFYEKVREEPSKESIYLIRLIDSPKAIDYSIKVIKLGLISSNIWLIKGNELFEFKDYKNAMKYYENAIKVDSDN